MAAARVSAALGTPLPPTVYGCTARREDAPYRQVGLANHHLLRHEHLLRRNLHAQVTPRDHDAVGLLQNFVKVVEALLVLNLGRGMGKGLMRCPPRGPLTNLGNDLNRAAPQTEHLAHVLCGGAGRP